MMKKDWTIKKLGELVTTINGLWKGKKPPFVNVAVIRNTNFSKDCQLKLDDVEYLDVEEKQFKTRQLHMGDIIIEKSGGSEKQPVGRPILFNIQDDNYSFSNFTSTLRINNQKEICSTFLQQYLYHRWLEGDTKSLQSHTTGIHNLDFKEFLNFDIPVPPLEEQKRIVDVLDKKFAQIETLKTAAEKNLNNTKQLFQAELEKAFSNTSWEKKKLGDVFAMVRGPFGGSLKKECFKSEGYPVYEQQCAIHSNYNFRYFIDERKYEEMKRFTVKAGDFVMSCSGVTMAMVSVVPDNTPTGIINQALLKLTPLDNNNTVFLKYYLSASFFRDKLMQYAKGAAIPNMPAVKILKEITLFLPSLPEQKRIVAHLNSLSEKVHQLEEIYTKQLADCDELKQSLLQKAFEGEL